MDRTFYKIKCPYIFRLLEVSFSYFSISMTPSPSLNRVAGFISVVVCTVLSTTNKNVFPDDSHLRLETCWVVESIYDVVMGWYLPNVVRCITTVIRKTKLNSAAFCPQANYTDRATAACWRS
jgi:uncharacterized membrane protein